MDDLMEMFSWPSWPETTGTGKLALDYTLLKNSSSTATTIEATAADLFSSFTNSSHPMGSTYRQGTSSKSAKLQESCANTVGQCSYDETHQDTVAGHTDRSMSLGQLQQHVKTDVQTHPHEIQETTYNKRQHMSRGSMAAPHWHVPTPISSNRGICSEISGCHAYYSNNQQSPSYVGSTVPHSYMGQVPSAPLGLAQVKTEVEETITGSQHPIKKRFHDDKPQVASQENFVNMFGLQQFRPTGQHLHSQVPAINFGSHTAIGHQHGVIVGPPRPRIRARRGQATDPHSIAERLRRERIAERMKALQELVPIANKTDKAAMLDEIIEYVHFLKLQMKVFSIGTLGAAGGVGPLIVDIPKEIHTRLMTTTALLPNTGAVESAVDDTLAMEQQVAKLMEEDIGSALQFLQKKGLCLMPIFLAPTISTSTPAQPPPGTGQGTSMMRTDSLSPT